MYIYIYTVYMNEYIYSCLISCSVLQKLLLHDITTFFIVLHLERNFISTDLTIEESGKLSKTSCPSNIRSAI